MTRYLYSNQTFRLLRQKSEKYTYSQVDNTLTYTPDAGTKRKDDGFNFDLVGNILKILNRTTDCGISGSILGSDALDREFGYDPLYRVISADGRESDTQDQNDYLYTDAPIPGSPSANNVRAYTRKYAFAGTDTNSFSDTKKDIVEDYNQAIGNEAPQYKQAADNARILSDELAGHKLTFIGHSLGGGLASAAALATGKEAITFNAAGLHPNTKRNYELNREAKIDAYVIHGEIVDFSQRLLPVPLKAEGHRFELPATYAWSIPLTNIDDAVRTYQRVNNHLMSTMISKIKQQNVK